MKDYVDIFNASFARALQNDSFNCDFISRFYDIFVGKSDEVAKLFGDTNMSAQKTMLHDSLHYMVEFFTSAKTGPHMESIARIHGRRELGISDEMYDLWLESLMEALKEFDPEFNDQVELAWRLVLSPGITYMKFVRDRM